MGAFFFVLNIGGFLPLIKKVEPKKPKTKDPINKQQVIIFSQQKSQSNNSKHVNYLFNK